MPSDLTFPRGFVAFYSFVHGHACAIHPGVAMKKMTDCNDLSELHRRLAAKYSKTKGGKRFEDCCELVPWRFNQNGDFQMLSTQSKSGRVGAVVMHDQNDPSSGPEIVLSFSMGRPEALKGKPCLVVDWNANNGWVVRTLLPEQLRSRMDRVQFLTLFDRWLASVGEPTIIQAVHEQAVCQSNETLFRFEQWLRSVAQKVSQDPHQELFPRYIVAAYKLFPVKRGRLVIPSVL